MLIARPLEHKWCRCLVGLCFLLLLLAGVGSGAQGFSLKSAVYLLGTYPQSGNDSQSCEPIEWLIIRQEKDKVLLLSRYCLDCLPYHDQAGTPGAKAECAVTWANSSLRYWLNGAFLRQAFTPEEKRRIVNTIVTSEQSQEEYDTFDYVFLLSSEQVRYFITEPAWRVAKPTAFARSRGAKTCSDAALPSFGLGCWWLRSAGESFDKGAIMHFQNKVEHLNWGDSSCGVRPALWLRKHQCIGQKPQGSCPWPELSNKRITDRNG